MRRRVRSQSTNSETYNNAIFMLNSFTEKSGHHENPVLGIQIFSELLGCDYYNLIVIGSEAFHNLHLMWLASNCVGTTSRYDLLVVGDRFKQEDQLTDKKRFFYSSRLRLEALSGVLQMISR